MKFATHSIKNRSEYLLVFSQNTVSIWALFQVLFQFNFNVVLDFFGQFFQVTLIEHVLCNCTGASKFFHQFLDLLFNCGQWIVKWLEIIEWWFGWCCAYNLPIEKTLFHQFNSLLPPQKKRRQKQFKVELELWIYRCTQNCGQKGNG